MSEKEIFLEDIIDRILTAENPVADLQVLRGLIKHQRAFDQKELEEMYNGIGGGATPPNAVVPVQTIDRMPFPVAVLLKNVNDQYNDLVRVLFLCDAVECYVRWRMSQMLGAIHHERGGVIPDKVIGRTSESILRPSMGSWISSYEHLAKQVENKNEWGTNKLTQEINALREITRLRNKLAHGDMGGDASKYLSQVQQHSKTIFDGYLKLNFSCFLNDGTASYPANGTTLGTGASPVSTSGTLDNRTVFFVAQSSQQTTVQIPCLFLVWPQETPAVTQGQTESSAPFLVGSYISSSHGKCEARNDGTKLEYTLINGTGIHTEKNTDDFIALFKTDKPVRANEPWLALMGEVSQGRSAAWDFDRKIIKACLKGYTTVAQSSKVQVEKAEQDSVLASFESVQITDQESRLWYFGGDGRIGKSTVLLSTIKELNKPDKAQFVFAHRFVNDATNPLDDFFFALREAVVNWLRRYTEVDEPNPDLSGEDLYLDVHDSLQELLAQPMKDVPQVLIGLDDLHCLFDPEQSLSEQTKLDALLSRLAAFGVSSTARVRKVGYDREARQDIVQAEQIRQVYCLATGLNLPTENADIDDYLHQHSQVEFVYHWFATNGFLLPSEAPNTKKKAIVEVRRDEIKSQTTKTPSSSHQYGAHLPMIGEYGAKRIISAGKLNKQLTQAFQQKPPSRGQTYIEDLVRKSKIGNVYRPELIEEVAEHLRSGVITIDDPITVDGQQVLTINSDGSYFEDISRLIPLLICYMDELKQPLTVTSLQILCNNREYPDPENDKYVLRALYAIPRLVKKVALAEADLKGNIAYGWALNDQDIARQLGLEHTQGIADRRIRELCAPTTFAQIPENVQLKEILRKRMSPSAAATTGNRFMDIHQSLRGVLTKGIRTTLSTYPSETVLQASASMLYQTNAVASAQTTWLQKSWESHGVLSQQADELTQKPSFNAFWLKHVNTEHHKIFSHQINLFAYPEKVQQIVPVNDEFMVVIGAKFSSVYVYHTKRSRPDVVLIPSGSKVKGCTVLRPAEERCTVVCGEGKHVHVYNVELSAKASVVFSETHDYQADVVGVEKISETEVVVFGKKFVAGAKKNAKLFQIDVLSGLETQKLSASVVTTEAAKDPKVSVVKNGVPYITFGGEMLSLSGGQPTTPVKIFSTPREQPTRTRLDLVTIGGSKKTEHTLTWFSVSRQEAQKCENGAGMAKFHSTCFADNIDTDHLLVVDYVGVLRVYKWGAPKPLCELQLDIPEAVVTHKEALKGGLLQGKRLLLYGAKAFMAFFDVDVAALLADPSSSSHIQKVDIVPHHFGGAVSNALLLEGSFLARPDGDLFVTIAADNDVRLWSFSQNDCIGLFRGHKDKMKLIVQYGGTLISADEKQNIGVWEINQGCVNQKQSLPQQTPNFVSAAAVFDDCVWSVTTKSSVGAYIDVYPQRGTGWSQQQAVNDQQQDPHPRFLAATAVKKTYRVKSFWVFHYDTGYSSSQRGLVAVYDMKSQNWLSTLQGQTEAVELSTLQVDDMVQKADGLLLYNKQEIHRLDTDLVIQQQVHMSEGKEIETVGSGAQHLVYAVKDIASTDREIYSVPYQGGPAVKMLSIPLRTKIEGVGYPNGHLLFWVYRDHKPLELYAYDSVNQRAVLVPQHPLLQKGPSQLQRLPIVDGFTFRAGETELRWVLRYDYPVVDDESATDEGTPAQKEWILEQQLAWAYSQEHTESLIAQGRIRQPQTVLPNEAVFAEVMPYGVVVHYKSQHDSRGRTLLWSGQTIRSHVLSALLPDGAVVLRKNRSIIVLQLMKGADPCAFSALFEA